jgi:cytochrome c oxidase cbb3-type subunit 3
MTMPNQTERERDDHSGVYTTGHEWDGIKELDNPLPRWWLIIFYACIAIAAVMWVLYPAWPGIRSYTPGILHVSDRAQVGADIAALKAGRRGMDEKLLANTLDQIETDPKLSQYARAAGEAAFGDNCATCHGVGGRGAKGYPSLADDVWLWGGTLADIEQTIKVGVRNDNPNTRFSQMPPYGQMYKPAQIDDLTAYVMQLSGQGGGRAAAARGAQLFATACTSCHGVDANGLRQFGAPSLRDKVWLNGGDRQAIHDQIWFGRNGVMPTWEHRLTPETLRALTIYVHELGGGEPTPPAVIPAAEKPTAAPAKQSGEATSGDAQTAGQ